MHRNQFATTIFGGGLEILQVVHSIWKSSMASISPVTGLNWAMTIQPLPTSVFSKSLSKYTLGLSSSSGLLTLFLLCYSWQSVEDDDKVTAAAKKLIADIDEAGKEKVVGSNFRYPKYAAGWQDPIKGYGEERLESLREASLKYGPEGVFQKLCEGGFKLSKS